MNRTVFTGVTLFLLVTVLSLGAPPPRGFSVKAERDVPATLTSSTMMQFLLAEEEDDHDGFGMPAPFEPPRLHRDVEAPAPRELVSRLATNRLERPPASC